MAYRDLCIKIAGEAGQGINVSALSLARAFTRQGAWVHLLTDNPNSIKLEHAWCSVRISSVPVACQSARVDVLVALSKDAVAKRQTELLPGAMVLFDSEMIPLSEADKRPGVYYYGVPLEQLTAKLKVPPVMRNTIALGALLGLLCYPLDALKTLIEEQFARKGEETVALNLSALEEGYHYVRQVYTYPCREAIEIGDPHPRMFLNGNEAFSAGALKAGLKFLSAYPMTPASPILHYLASKEKEYNLVVKHTEDEIAAANMAIGAAYAGVRAMTCTSGGGFCLMTEALGLAAQAEVPVVFVLGQRPGPATGQPTHTAQGDLLFALHASQGEFPRFILASGDAQEAFFAAQEAFNLAERFQVPVIVLTDKYLGESYVTADPFDLRSVGIDRGEVVVSPPQGEYARYRLTEHGVSPRAFPGTAGAIHLATSYEHDEYGYYAEDQALVKKMFDKRTAKMSAMQREVPPPVLLGVPADQAQVTLVSWGSNKGPILEALEMLAASGIKANYLHFTHLWPFPSDKAGALLRSCARTILVELNQTGQLGQLIARETGYVFGSRILKYDGQPFYPDAIFQEVQKGFSA
jgi:2-oxoglutarate/2-oxoacid ferredoxin oxidoreductase subunit alpha